MSDILEEAKSKLKHMPFTLVVKEILGKLIEEVERLEKMAKVDDRAVRMKHEQIELLQSQLLQSKRNLEEANHILMDIPFNSNPDLMIRELKKQLEAVTCSLFFCLGYILIFPYLHFPLHIFPLIPSHIFGRQTYPEIYQN